MKIKTAENIRRYRKERGLTQERLAEILGVTVGAVSKWEAGASVPDIALILEMADFFEISVDVLLGYDHISRNINDTTERIKKLRNEKKFDLAVTEAEKALERYPNNFEITFQSAILYSLKGVEQNCQKSYRRALSLFERSLELLAQNTDEHINEWSIKNHIARLYLCMGQTDKALERMKKNNVDNLNDGEIGYTIAVQKNAPDDALPYLSDALTTHVTDIFRVMIGFINSYIQKKDFASALDSVDWVASLIEGLKKPPVVSYYDKLAATVYMAGASVCMLYYDTDKAKEYLRKAKETAERFDADPSYDFKATKFHHGNTPNTAFDDFGATAEEGIIKNINNDSKREALMKIWEDLKND